jgi:hypothetical protein
MSELSTATPSVLRLASILVQAFQVSDMGSYTSTLRTRSDPLKPPTAYTKPFRTARPANENYTTTWSTIKIFWYKEKIILGQVFKIDTSTLRSTRQIEAPFVDKVRIKPATFRSIVHRKMRMECKWAALPSQSHPRMWHLLWQGQNNRSSALCMLT